MYSSINFVEPTLYQLNVSMHVKETGNTKHPVVKKLFVNHIIPKNNTGIVLKITVFNFTFFI